MKKASNAEMDAKQVVKVKELLRRALAKLPSQDAEIFVLCYLEGYTYEELAEQFGIERGTIGSRLYRIKTALKKELSI